MWILVSAAYNNDLEKVKNITTLFPEISVREAANYASSAGNLEVFRFLYSVNRKDINLREARYEAVKREQSNMIKWIDCLSEVEKPPSTFSCYYIVLVLLLLSAVLASTTKSWTKY